jgi:hypothetical protein
MPTVPERETTAKAVGIKAADLMMILEGQHFGYD